MSRASISIISQLPMTIGIVFDRDDLRDLVFVGDVEFQQDPVVSAIIFGSVIRSVNKQAATEAYVPFPFRCDIRPIDPMIVLVERMSMTMPFRHFIAEFNAAKDTVVAHFIMQIVCGNTLLKCEAISALCTKGRVRL